MQDNSYSVGVPAMDAEHEIQVQLVRSYARAIAEGARDRAAELLDQLEEFTNVHFASEETLMRLHSYPSYRGHMQQHELHMNDLARLRAALAGSIDEVTRVSEEVERWLTIHIQTADQAFADYMRSHSRGMVEGAPAPA